ncbi:transmembrane protein 68-like isoform X2 [Hemicordylus capensis]|uniref:transmembrane protein 68-like isoform X2 n=1 Tax=Hemicordylus capensis TaxID=884348 RepID=UPI0023034784|nr:transmembrane protein 68-like isoform X2 [Hemicordylus capensis]
MISLSESYSSGEESVTWLTSLLKEWICPDHYLGIFTDYKAYLWVLIPFIMLFSPVLILLGFIYLSTLLLHIYKIMSNLKGDYLGKSWNTGRRAVSYLWDIYGIVWHGYEVHGMNKVPEGPGLIVCYHGAFPLDYFYFVSRLYLQTGRLCHTVVDYNFSKIPGINLFYNVHGLTNDGRMGCVEILKKGNLLGVLPGGAREAFFSDENYSLVWGGRLGFAHVARDAKVTLLSPNCPLSISILYLDLRTAALCQLLETSSHCLQPWLLF